MKKKKHKKSKRIVNILKSRKLKFVIGFIIGIVITGSVYAVTYTSSEVFYDNTTSGLVSDNVQDGLDELKVSAQSCGAFFVVTADGNGGGVSSYDYVYGNNGWVGSDSSKQKMYQLDATVYGTLPTATRGGFTFDGWYTQQTGGTQVTASTPISSTTNHTIYAHWSTTCTTGLNSGTTYTVGSTITYAGASFTVVSDNGDNVSLAYNGVSGSGSYDNASTYLASNFLSSNTTFTAAKNSGCLVDQGSNEYITANSGYNTANPPAYDHWLSSGTIRIASSYCSSLATSTSEFYAGYKQLMTSNTYGETELRTSCSCGTYSNNSAGETIFVSSSDAAIQHHSCSSSTTSTKYATNYRWYSPFDFTTPSSSKLPMEHCTMEWGSCTGEFYQTSNTKTWKMIICGGSNHGSTYTMTASSATQYKTTAPGGSATARNYSKGYEYAFAGSVSSTTTGSSPSYVRTYNFSTASGCAARTVYTDSTTSRPIYYRPFIKVWKI